MAALVSILALVGVTSSLIFYGFATVIALRFARRAAMAPPPLPKVPPRVAILKPLRGLSASLFTNVVSFLELDYPRRESVFGVADYNDRAAEVPVGLKPRYQTQEIRLVIGGEPNAVNYKVAKLIRMAERAPKADIIVLSDADVAVEPDHLRRVVGELSADERTGIVTCAYRARPLGGFASRMKAAFVNTDFFPMAMVATALEPMHYAFGATIAIKRGALESIGGFAALKDLLADDFHLGRMVAERGYTVRLSSSLVTVSCEQRHFADFWHHQLRWARTYHSVRPLSIASILIHGPFWALLLLIASGLSPVACGLFAAVIASRITMAAVMVGKVLGLPEQLADLWLVPLKDLIMTAVWFASLFGDEVQWSGRRFKLLPAGKMKEIA